MSENGSPDAAQRKQEVSGLFGRAASTYDRVGPRFFSYFGRRLVEIARIPGGSTVLDVATGRGALLFPAAESAGPRGSVIGIDLSEMMVQQTAKELATLKMPANIEVQQMDAEHLQFADESFDYVLCGFALFFFPQLGHAMSEFRRVLKPNGHICISTWDKLGYEQGAWYEEIVENYLPAEPEADQASESDSLPQPVFDTPAGLETILNDAGFDGIQIFSEATELAYPTEEDFWSTLWSHGGRRTLEEIEKTTGRDGLQRFRSEVFAKFSTLKQSDGLHESFRALVALARKPGG